MIPQKRHSTLKGLFYELADQEAEELAERLEFGDDESVLAWLMNRYPKHISRVVDAQRWPEFICLVRQLYESDRDAQGSHPQWDARGVTGRRPAD